MDALVDKIEEQHGWERLFRAIKSTSADYNLQYKAARLPENKNRNRYRDVSPYDHSRVKLIDSENDYINGSQVDVPDAGRKYILAQGPLPHTAGHFWLMVWEQNSAAVIMLNRIIEKGAIKCSQYFPMDETPLVFPEVALTVVVKRQQVSANYTVRYMELQNNKTDEVREILQFHYTTWPDFGVPESPAAFLDFLNCVRDSGVLEATVGPPVIHCSAGIGRSGTFALVDSCLVFIEKDIEFDVKETLLEMRKYRMGLIQTAQQLRFSYLAIAEGARSMRDTAAEQSTETSESEASPYNSTDEDEEDDPPGDQHQEENVEKSNEQEENIRKRHAENKPESKDEKREKPPDEKLPVNNHDNIGESVIATKLMEANNNSTELRKRKLSEKNEALRKQVTDIKNKMRESEKNRNSFWKPFLIGGLVLTATIGAAVIYRMLH